MLNRLIPDTYIRHVVLFSDMILDMFIFVKIKIYFEVRSDLKLPKQLSKVIDRFGDLTYMYFY